MMSACGISGLGQDVPQVLPGPNASETPDVPDASPAPALEEPFTFAVIGDFGTGMPAQHEVAARMCRWRANKPFDLVITTGDNVYDHGHPDDFPAKFFEPYRCLLDEGVRFHASLGNHDVETDGGRPQLQEPAFGMKGRNYVVREGGVRFVIADSNPLDKSWLRRAAARREGDRWVVVAFHHPVYSGGTEHGSTVGFEDVSRMLARRDVDLVLNGHDHIYSASRRMEGGVRYVVTGGGGAPLYGCTSRSYIRRCVSRHHFLYVTASEEELRVRAVPRNGKPFHRFTIR
jgi:3',5'-cyclic AMP phosphodiesterase CpdA